MNIDPTDAMLEYSYTALIDDLATVLDLNAGLAAATAGQGADIVDLHGSDASADRQQVSVLAADLRGVLDLEAGLAAITARPHPNPPASTGPATTALVTTTPILVIDDHQLVGSSLALSLKAEGEDARFIPVRTAQGILEAAASIETGLAVVDLDLGQDPDGNRIDGVRLVEPLVSTGWRVLVLTGSSDAGRIGAALMAGGFTWVPKNAPFPTLLAAIREARQGRSTMPPGRREQLITMHLEREAEHRDLTVKLAKLTSREREVLALLAAGKRAQAVAEHFTVSLITVRTQVRAVLVKLEADSHLEAIAIYRRIRGD